MGEKFLTDAAVDREVGTDFYVPSLRDAVEACHRSAGHASKPERRAA